MIGRRDRDRRVPRHRQVPAHRPVRLVLGPTTAVIAVLTWAIVTAPAAPAEPLPGPGAPVSQGTDSGSAEDPGTVGLARDQATPLAAVAVDTVLGNARLGAPQVTITAPDGALVLQVEPAPRGPAPTALAVRAIGPDGHERVVCPPSAERTCTDTEAAPASVQTYRVSAHLGDRWRQEAPPVQAFTPPPPPALQVVLASARPRIVRPGSPPAAGEVPAAGSARVMLTAPPGQDPYRIDVLLDDVPAPLRTVKPAPGASTVEQLDLAGLASGSHTLIAIATYHGLRSAAEPLQIALAADGTISPARLVSSAG